jgi:hypothetical protein
MNKMIKPKHGDVYIAHRRNEYRMYVKVFEGGETLMCINLNTGESYVHTQENGMVQPGYEKFAFNMCEVVTSNIAEDT